MILPLEFLVWATKYLSQKLTSDSLFEEDQAKVFRSPGASKADIITAVETAIYNGNPQLGINVLRYEKFCAKVTTTTGPVQPCSTT